MLKLFGRFRKNLGMTIYNKNIVTSQISIINEPIINNKNNIFSKKMEKAEEKVEVAVEGEEKMSKA
jgi:hypothetical protein